MVILILSFLLLVSLFYKIVMTFKTLLEIIGFSLSTITYAIKSIGNYNN
jgi:hypothetical protein